MRILHFMETYWPLVGGREVLIENLSEATLQRGHEVRVVTGMHSPALLDRETRRGIEVRRFPFREALMNRNVRDIGRTLAGVSETIRDFAPDLVHLHDFGPIAMFCVRSIKAKPRRLLLSVHGTIEDTRLRPKTMLALLLDTADWIAAVSVAALSRIRQLAPHTAGRSSVVHNGCLLPPILPAPLPFHPPRILVLGRFGAEKRIDAAVRAFATVRQEFPDARMTLCGDGPLRQELQRQAMSLGVADAMEFVGMLPTEQVWPAINRATMLVMPSRIEGLPLAALEASVMCRPVVATAVGGLPEVVIDGATGRLTPPGDDGALADAMTELLRDPERSVRMGAAARTHVLTAFGWDRFVDQYHALYCALCEEII